MIAGVARPDQELENSSLSTRTTICSGACRVRARPWRHACRSLSARMFNRYPNPRAIQKFSGVVPVTKKSGKPIWLAITSLSLREGHP